MTKRKKTNDWFDETNQKLQNSVGNKKKETILSNRELRLLKYRLSSLDKEDEHYPILKNMVFRKEQELRKQKGEGKQ